MLPCMHVGEQLVMASSQTRATACNAIDDASNVSHLYHAWLHSCDGVIVETEELHRKAYNGAFESYQCTINGQPLVWSVEYYVSAA